jgi:polyhydroxyalkanoate synthesis regulator phasin
LNETAAWLWKEAEAQGEFTVNSLADKLCEEYEVTAEQARQDVDAIVKKWQEVEVVE